MKMRKVMNVGLIGCGNISGAYLGAAPVFSEIMKITRCADLNREAADAKAKEFGLKSVSVDDILSDPEIDIILNLTIPAAHAEVNLKALTAGKHVHCEKPFALNREEGKKILQFAAKKKLKTGCAPDTFLGGGIQTCRKIIDDGWIGRPVAGTAFMMCPGHERWHPNPGFYYLPGGGPMLDMGPYYLTALVNLLGPVRRVCGSSSAAYKERIATSKELYGKKLPVKVQTHHAGVVDFECGAIVTVVMSFDVQAGGHGPIEIYGTDGSIKVPDPNGFCGPVSLFKKESGWRDMPLSHIYTDNMRVIGVADMASAICSGRENRCSGELAYHVLDVMLAFEDSSRSGRHIEIKSSCRQPVALPTGLLKGHLY